MLGKRMDTLYRFFCYCALGLVLAGCSLMSSDQTLTEKLRRVTYEVPAFGGVDFEGSQLTVYLLGGEQREKAKTVLAQIFGDEAREILLLERLPRGRASEQLKSKARDVLTVAGASSLDYDETTGYLRVGVVEAEAIERAEIKLIELGVSLEMVIRQVERPIRLQ